jgi:hypothetical protein
LQDDPSYVKALQRRALSNETINTWSSLTSAQEGLNIPFGVNGVDGYHVTDYTKLLTLLPSSSSQVEEIRRTLRRLKPRVEAAQKKETDEMLGKLKGLGNSILGAFDARSRLRTLSKRTFSGNFGLSTDNFKFEPNGQGGYSMNFSR